MFLLIPFLLVFVLFSFLAIQLANRIQTRSPAQGIILKVVLVFFALGITILLSFFVLKTGMDNMG